MKIRCHPLLWILLLSLPFFVVDLGKPALTDSEAMYAEIAREMRAGEDWITPHINGTRHFDKPPLLCWLIAFSQTCMGETEAAARLWPALSSWAAILLVGAIGTRLYGRRAGWLSALALAGSLGPYIFSRLVRPDPLLCFWTSLAILSYTRGLREDGKWVGAWPWIMFCSFGLAGLTKGLLGIGLPSGIIGLHAILSGRSKSLFSWRAAAGICVTTFIFAPWHVIVAKNNPDFLEHYLFREHILRFTGQRYPIDEFLSVAVFLSLTFLWTFPWMALFPLAAADAFRWIKRTAWRKGEDLLPCLWFFLVVGLFTASRSRLEYYALPAIPAFALLMGKMWDDLLQGSKQTSPRFALLLLGSMCSIAGLATVSAGQVLGPSKDIVFHFVTLSWPGSGWTGFADQLAVLERIRIPTVAVLTGSALFMLGALIAVKTSRPGFACGLLAGMMAPIFILVHWGFLLMEPFQSSRPAAEMLKSLAPLEAVVVQEPREYSWISGIVYYSKRMVYVLKDSRFDKDTSRHREPPERFLNQEEFSKLWKSGKIVALVCDQSLENDIRGLPELGPVNEIGRFGSRVVVSTGTAIGSVERRGPP